MQNAAAPLNTPQSGRRTVGRSQTPIVNNAETLDPQPALKDRIHQHQRDKYQLWQPGSAQGTKENLPAWSGIGDAPSMNDIETVAQKAQAAADAEKEKAKNEAKDLWRQYTDAVSRGTEDTFLASLNYGPDLEGFAQLYDDIQATLGESEFETLISETSPVSADEISPIKPSYPKWKGRRGEKYMSGLEYGWSDHIFFDDSNSEDTIEYLKNINQNTPIAGGISGIIDVFDNYETRMITRIYEITAEEINRERAAQTEKSIRGAVGSVGSLMDIVSAIYGGMTNQYDSANVTNDIFKDYGIKNITGQFDIYHEIADWLTLKVSGNETYTREETSVYFLHLMATESAVIWKWNLHLSII